MVRDLNKEAWCWYHITSDAFYQGAVDACRKTFDFFREEALKHNAANFSRNNQIHDTWKRHVRELEKGIEFTHHGDYAPINEAASDVAGTTRGIAQWGNMTWLGGQEKEYERLSNICTRYVWDIQDSLWRALFGGDCWICYAEHPEEGTTEQWNRGQGHGLQGDRILSLLEGYPHFKDHRVPSQFPIFAPDKSRPIKSGEKTPWTGVWIPAEGLDRRSLTFAIEGLPMTCSWRIVQSLEENEAELLKNPKYHLDEYGLIVDEEDEVINSEQTCAIEEMTWYPLIQITETEIQVQKHDVVRGGQPCPRDGYWWSPANKSEGGIFKKGDTMPDFPESDFGLTFWYWEIGTEKR
jgi:hypothetical protein